MAKILDRDEKTVLLKVDIKEFDLLNNSWFINYPNENIEDYEFVFDKPLKASQLLKTF